MELHQITPDITVSPQIAPEDVAEAARLGFRTLICNRPDEETAPGYDSAAMAEAAQAAGLAFHYLPYYPGELTARLADAFTEAFAEAEKPVLAYCRSGTRSSHLWALAEAPYRPVAETVALAGAAGYDHSGLAPLIAARAETA